MFNDAQLQCHWTLPSPWPGVEEMGQEVRPLETRNNTTGDFQFGKWGYPKHAGWFMGKSHRSKWMMTGGPPIYGNPHIFAEMRHANSWGLSHGAELVQAASRAAYFACSASVRRGGGHRLIPVDTDLAMTFLTKDEGANTFPCKVLKQ